MDKELDTVHGQPVTSPDDADALARLEGKLLDAGDWEGLVALTAERADQVDEETSTALWVRLVDGLEQFAANLADERALSQLALVLGRIWETHLDSAEEAMIRYQKAFQLDPANRDALVAARAIYQRRENWELVIQLYQLEIQGAVDLSEQADLCLELAAIHRDQLGQPMEAVICVRTALELVPDHPGAEPFGELLEAVHRDFMFRVEELRTTAEQARDPRQKAALLNQAASILLEASPGDVLIEELLTNARNADQRQDDSRVLLENYLLVNQRWDDLVSHLIARAESTPRKNERQEIYQQLAEIAQSYIGDAEKAVGWHREVLKLDPVDQTSLNYCVEYYSDNETWLDMVEVYEAALRTRHRGGNESAMLVQIAMVLWRKVEDLKAAENYFKRIKLNDPRNPLMLHFYTEFYEHQKDYKRLLGVLGTRQNNEEDDEGKIAIGLEMANVAEDKLGNMEKAIDIWKSILKVQADHPVARDALQRLFFRTGKWNALLEFLKEELALLDDADVEGKVSVFQKIIEIYRDQLNLPVMVINTYNQILQFDPSNAAALDALQQKYESSARWNDLIQILARRLEVAAEGSDTDTMVRLNHQIAGLWLDKFSNPNQAIPYLEGVLEIAPTDQGAISQLVEIYRHRKDYRALFAIEQRRMELLEGDARIDLMGEMAGIAATRLDEPEKAIELWEAVRESAPERDEAWTALDGLYQRTGHWEALAALHRGRAARSTTTEERLIWQKRLAHVLAERIGDEDAGAAAWRDVLGLSPGDLHAESYLRELYLRRGDWEGLESLYAERGDWEGLVRLYGMAASQAESLELRVELFRRMARVCHAELMNEPAAIECWERILAEAPESLEAARTLAPYYTRTEQWDDLANALQVILRNGTSDPVPLMIELATVHEVHRGDAGQAYLWYARALEGAPHQGELLAEARRAAEAAGAGELFVELIESLVETVEGAEVEVRLRRTLAEICAEELGRIPEAAEHLQRVRVLEGDQAADLTALGGLYLRLGDWDALLEVQTSRLDLAEDDRERAEILAALGELHETARDDADAAQAAYEELRALDSDNMLALRGLQRLAEQRGDGHALSELVEAELSLATDQSAISGLRFRLGQLAERRGDLEEALDRYASVLADEATHMETLRALDQFLDGAYAARAARLLEPSLRAGQQWSSLRRVLELQVAGAEDVVTRVRLLHEVANIRERQLSDPRGAFDAWARALVEEPVDAEGRAQIERLAGELDHWEGVVNHYARLGLGGDLMADEPAVAALYTRRLAAIQEERLGAFAQARSSLELLLAERGEDLEVLEALERLVTRLQDWPGLVEVAERKLALIEDSERHVDLLFRIGDLHEEVLDDPEAAIEVYRRVLAVDPAHARATASLERLFRNTSRFAELANLIESQIDDAVGDTRARLLYQLAQVLEGPLSAPAEALERYADVLALVEDHEPATEAIEEFIIACADASPEHQAIRARACALLEPVYTARDDWQSQIHLLQVRLDDETDPAARVEFHLRIARMREARAQDRPAAFGSFSAAFSEDYGNAEVLGELERLAGLSGDWTPLAAVLRRGLDEPSAASALDGVTRREMLAKVAEIYEERVGDVAEAVRFNRRVLDEDPLDAVALERLDRLYVQIGDAEPLAEILERRLELADGPQAQAELAFRLGALFEVQLDTPERAVAVYERIRGEFVPGDVRAYEALERVHSATGDYGALVEVVLEHANLDSGGPEARRTLLFRAAATYEDALDRPEAAVEIYQRVRADDADDREALAQLDRLFGQLSLPVDLLDVIEREHALAETDAARSQLDLRMGDLLRTRLGDLTRAVGHYEAILSRNPEEPAAIAALSGLLDEPEVRLTCARLLAPIFEQAEDFARLRDVLEGTLRDVTDPAERRQTQQRIAVIEEERLGAPAAAFDTLSEAYRESEGDAELEAELARLAEVTGAEAALADLLAEVVVDAPARAVEIRTRIAALAEEKLGELGRAIDELRAILDLEPEHRATLDRLDRLYGLAESPAALVEIVERKATLAETPEERRGLLERAAELHESALDDRAAAIETWRLRLADDGGDEVALAALERLLDAESRHAELAALYEHWLGLDLEAPRRADLEYRLARVNQIHLLDGLRAIDLYRSVLDADAEHPLTRAALAELFGDAEVAARAGIDPLDVAAMLEPLYRADQDFASLIPVLEARQASMLDEPAERVSILREIARLSEREIGDARTAMEAIGRAFRLAPEEVPIRQELHRLAEATYQFESLCGLLSEALETAHDPSLQVELMMELGRTCEVHLGRDDQARDVYRDALQVEPGHPPAVEALVALFSRTTGWEELVDLYLTLAEGTGDLERQKALLFKACQLFEDVLDDPERAIRTYRQVLAIEPENAQACRALERFFTAHERWSELADLLREEARFADDPTVRAELRHRLAGVLSTQLGELDTAIETWWALLEEDAPGHEGAIEALESLLIELDPDDSETQRRRVAEILEPIYAGGERWSDWVMALEVLLASELDRWQRLETLVRIARAQETHLSAPGAALEAYSRAFAEDYGNPEVQTELDRLGEQLGAWGALVNAYLSGIETFADLDAAVGILLKVGRIFDRHLDEPARATDCFRRVLMIDETNGEAIGALERLFAAQGEHRELVGVLHRKAEFTSDPLEKKELLYRICEIWEDVLDRPDQAIETYRRVYENEPEDQNAIEALIRLYERTSQWELLVEMLRDKLEAAGDQAERRGTLLRVARIYEEQLHETDETILTYRTLLEMDARDRAALDALDRLFSREDRWGELIDLLETERDTFVEEHPERVAALELRIADVLEHQLQQVEQAVEIYGDLLKRFPDSPARAALERLLGDEEHRLQACEMLAPHYEAMGEPEVLARVLELELLDLTDPMERTERLKRLARLRYDVLKHPRSAFDTQARAFAEEPADPETIEALHELADELKLHGELAQLYEEHLPSVLDAEVSLDLARRLARLYEHKLADVPRALAAWRSVVQTEPLDAEALVALDTLYQAQQAWGELIEVLQRRIEVGAETELADLRFRLGYLMEVVRGDVAEAINQYRTVLWEHPDHVYSREAMERLAVHLEYRQTISDVLEPIYRDAKLWDKLAILTEMRIELGDNPIDQALLWRAVADLKERRLGDAEGAFEATLRALAAQPEDAEIRDAAIRLGTERGAWSRMVEVFEVISPALMDLELRTEDHLRVADWCRGRLRDPARAVLHYQAVLELDESNSRALDALEMLYEDAEDWQSLAAVLRRRADATFDLDEKKTRLHQLGELAAGRLGDGAVAVEAYTDVLAIDDVDARALVALERIHEVRGEWDALCGILERRTETTYDPDALAEIHRRLGRLCRDHADDAGRAALSFERLLEIEVADVEAIASLRAIYSGLEDWYRLQEVLVKALSVAEGVDERVEILRALGDNAGSHLNDAEGAIEYLRQLLTHRPDDARAMDRLLTVFEQENRPFDLVEALKARLATLREAGDLDEVVRTLVRIAGVAEGQLHDEDLAIECLNEVLELQPDHPGAQTVLARLHQRRGEWDKAAEILERVVEVAGADDERAAAYRQLGELLRDHLGRHADARAAFEAAVSETGDADSLAALLVMARDAKDDPWVAALLRRRLTETSGDERLPLLLEIAELSGRIGDPVGAVVALEEAYGLAPEDLRVADALIEAYLAAERFDDAEPILRGVIERLRAGRRSKDLYKYAHRLGILAEGRGDEAGALAAYTESFSHDATYLPNLIRLGRLHVRQQSWDEALKIFQNALLHQMKLDRDGRVDVFFHLGQVRLALGDPRKAKDMFNRALSLNAEHAPSLEALSELST